MTNDQRKYLESLVCERISANEANKELIAGFVNWRNPTIAENLRNGWEEDQQGKLAYYIVKDPELDVPMMFFSLKCGEMHIPLDSKKLGKTVTNALMLLKQASIVCNGMHFMQSNNAQERTIIMHYTLEALRRIETEKIEVNPWAEEAIEKQLVNGTLTEKAWKKIWRRVFNALKYDLGKQNDESLQESNIVRTKETFPAVELVHFCIYDPILWSMVFQNYPKEFWKELQKTLPLKHNPVVIQWHNKGMGNRSLARTMFWKFVVPVIQDLGKLVGCEYVYLFAADDDSDEEKSLLRYYRKLGFDFQDRIYVTKPSFDFGCFFMCQKISALPKKRNAFFRNYNRQEGKKPAQPEAPVEA